MTKKTLILFFLFLGLIFWQIDPEFKTWQIKAYFILIGILGVYITLKDRMSLRLERAYKNEKRYETSLGDIVFNYPDSMDEERIKMIDEKLKEIEKKYPL